ncbi:general substrate transporter [Suillus clintonianus]|uniref:general substrate transporter n=1 Tax=Suillus clintonianus TaxID=1904413 RepID=UPI001B861333|nr:general substrate transporter [Suillus clintonianus]KAG2115507.1 general substrate transporter [Suillus clintonianus]
MTSEGAHTFTKYGWLVCLWVLTASFQYGYHTSALNQLQGVLTCKIADPTVPVYYGLPTCIPMSDATFSVVTSMYTFGGFFGSLSANIVMDRYGRKGASRLSAALTASGSAVFGLSSSVGPLILGRFLVGLAAGLGICLCPIYLSEIAPAKIKGNLGVLTQLAIVIGIMVTQGMGFGLATPRQWRLVLFISSGISIFQYFISPFVVESPSYLNRKGLVDQQKVATRRLWGEIHGVSQTDPEELDNDSEEPLLSDSDSVAEHRSTGRQPTMTIPQLFASTELRRPLLTIIVAMMSQQISGINAVLYYSNDILSKSLPELASYVSLGITIVNFFMTFPPIFLIERVGRKQLIQLSVACALLSHLAVGYGLNNGLVTLSSIAITTFVMSFAFGLGPIPFVMIPEVAPPHAVSAISSVGLSLNWSTNFVIGLIFLPLRNFLAHGDPMKEGRVFYLFAAALFCSTLWFSKLYRG